MIAEFGAGLDGLREDGVDAAPGKVFMLDRAVEDFLELIGRELFQGKVGIDVGFVHTGKEEVPGRARKILFPEEAHDAGDALL